MATKDPTDFEIGDVIKNSPGTPYSGSPITLVEPMEGGQTEVHFENGEVVHFFNGILHEMKE